MHDGSERDADAADDDLPPPTPEEAAAIDGRLRKMFEDALRRETPAALNALIDELDDTPTNVPPEPRTLPPRD